MSANSADAGPKLEAVIMPLVRVLATGEWSWAERVRITEAIAVCERQWRSMEGERRAPEMSVGAQQVWSTVWSPPTCGSPPFRDEKVPWP